jgi:hypothetical protein
MTSAAVLPEELEAALVDAHRVADGLELRLALHRAGEVELDVEGDDLDTVERGERVVVPHGHHVVEPVHADAPPALVLHASGDVRSRPLVEGLLEAGGAVLPDVAGLRREDDPRVAVDRDDDVRVPVHDLEPREVCHGTLEPGVLAPGDDERVQVVLRQRGADVRVAALELRVQVHEASSPLTRAVTASFSGVATPSSRPKRPMPPFR